MIEWIIGIGVAAVVAFVIYKATRKPAGVGPIDPSWPVGDPESTPEEPVVPEGTTASAPKPVAKKKAKKRAKKKA